MSVCDGDLLVVDWQVSFYESYIISNHSNSITVDARINTRITHRFLGFKVRKRFRITHRSDNSPRSGETSANYRITRREAASRGEFPNDSPQSSEPFTISKTARIFG